ncbi:tRNA dihydrouridine(20/20a) synthase DusA [Halorhodospira halochloris]|uniref:tRNA dihydrouridine(20/20a) synthase DusA n=1 Tax=Halorhodospira halochloris TaxID=1052 RepID=UPI002378747A|nr:tRNA dihydrouridine(20/20a) synthase DusA [Halorhodospira halochloris]
MTGNPLKPIHGPLSVAPMMDWTTTHARYFLRMLAPRVRLYSEMVPVLALWHGDPQRFLDYDPAEHPIALQLGGSSPEQLAYGSRLAAQWGYDEVNLNVGCPSGRVSAGRFGACLMLEPELVAECVQALHEGGIPVTVKTRIGVDDHDSYDYLHDFIARLAEAGCSNFIVHARKAWLSGLSPKENREIPPLDYPRVHRLKRDFPHLEIVLNGGIASEEVLLEQFGYVDGVMVGREAFANPYSMALWECSIMGGEPPARREAVEEYLPYVERQRQLGVPMSQLVKVLMGLYRGCKGARLWRRHLSEGSQQPGAGPEVITQALRQVEKH